MAQAVDLGADQLDQLALAAFLRTQVRAPRQQLGGALEPGQRIAQFVRQPGSVRLTVIATELRNAQGEVAFTIYPDDSSRFLAKKGKLPRILNWD